MDGQTREISKEQTREISKQQVDGQTREISALRIVRMSGDGGVKGDKEGEGRRGSSSFIN